MIGCDHLLLAFSVYYSFSAASHLFLIWYLVGNDRTEGTPTGQQQGFLLLVRVVQLSVLLNDDIWFFFHDGWGHAQQLLKFPVQSP